MRLTTRVWNRLPARFLLALTALAALPAVLPAGPVTFTTGDLGAGNIISDNFRIQPNLKTPNDALPAGLDVKFGLFSGTPPLVIDVLVNGTNIGTLQAMDGYLAPGPTFATFNVTGLLDDGINTILFQEKSAGTYIIGQVDIRYDDSGNPIRSPVASAPEPATIWLLGAGSVVAVGYARRRRAARHA